MTREAYILVLIETLKKYIMKVVYGYKNLEVEDAMQSAYEAIIANVDVYDPRKAAITTFFTGRMREMVKVNMNDNRSKHYRDLEVKLNRIARQYGYTDMYDKRLTLPMLSLLSGVSPTSIKTLTEQNYVVISNDSDEGGELVATNMSPEAFYIEKEKKELVNNAKSVLTPLERYLLDVKIENPRSPYADFPEYFDSLSEDDKTKSPSIRAITIAFNDIKDLQEEFKSELPALPVSSNFIETKLLKAQNKLFNNMSLRKYRQYDGDEIVMFSDDSDDIRAALEAELL